VVAGSGGKGRGKEREQQQLTETREQRTTTTKQVSKASTLISITNNYDHSLMSLPKMNRKKGSNN